MPYSTSADIALYRFKENYSNTSNRLGENPSFIFVLYQFLVDRAKENDYAGELSRSAFEVRLQFVRFEAGSKLI